MVNSTLAGAIVSSRAKPRDLDGWLTWPQKVNDVAPDTRTPRSLDARGCLTSLRAGRSRYLDGACPERSRRARYDTGARHFDGGCQGHFANAFFPIFTPLGIVTDVRPRQYAKAHSPIDVTLFGIVTDVRPSQLRKANVPIDVTLFGIVTDVRPVQPLKVIAPIDVTLSGIVTDVRPRQP